MKINWLIIILILPLLNNYQWADDKKLVDVKIDKLNKDNPLVDVESEKSSQENPEENQSSIKTIFDDVVVKKSMAVESMKVSKKKIVHKKKSRWNRLTSFVKNVFKTLRSYLKPIALGLLFAVIVGFNNGSLSGTAIKNLLFFFPEATS